MVKTIDRELGKTTIDKVRKELSPVSFAEQYLEEPVYVGADGVNYSAGPTVTVCTWRGIPTIDDF